jgi:PTH1 family peptidyl-tRNA hydrolase
VKLIVGLGNPGVRYHDSRHNVGFQVIDNLRTAYDIALQSYLQTAVYGEGTMAGQAVVLALPLTYMNRSGEAVVALCAHFTLSPSDVIVVHDDLDLPLGRVKLKMRGGDAGHYGVRSIIECLGTEAFPRVRVGIGRPASRDEVVAFVLSRFTPEELPLLHDAVQNAAKKVEQVVSLG